MTISTDAEKAFHKIQHPFQKKKKKKTSTNVKLNGERLNVFIPKIRNKAKMSTLATSTQHSFRGSGQWNRLNK